MTWALTFETVVITIQALINMVALPQTIDHDRFAAGGRGPKASVS